MRSLSYRPRKEDSKKEEVKEVVVETLPAEVEPDLNASFDESVVLS